MTETVADVTPAGTVHVPAPVVVRNTVVVMPV
jgi:hypothetical protein